MNTDYKISIIVAMIGLSGTVLSAFITAKWTKNNYTNSIFINGEKVDY